MRIIMFGTGPFAVPTFQSLLRSDHDVLALFTRPIRDGGKRRKTSENPTRDAGEAAGLPIFDPPDINAPEAIHQLKSLAPELYVVCDYGQILSRECLSVPARGGINLHGSLLPAYRGAAPINWCVYDGNSVTGITIIHMTPKLDGGPCLVRAQLDIGAKETAEQLEPRLAELGVEPVHQAIKILQAWDGESQLGEPQDPNQATRAPRLKKQDGLIDWSRSAEAIVNQIRAFQPWPGSYTNWHAEDRKAPVRLILHAASAMAAETGAVDKTVGEVATSGDDQLVVQTGDGLLSIDTIQPAGKRAMPIAEFLRGNSPRVGDRFGA